VKNKLYANKQEIFTIGYSFVLK